MKRQTKGKRRFPAEALCFRAFLRACLDLPHFAIMELRTLRYFLAVAQEENITKAAELLHVTQPTSSRQIMELEKELGVTLLFRGKNGLTLSDDGALFRQRAEEIVELADRLRQTFVQRNTEVSGVIAIGATEAVGSRVFAKLIQEFSAQYPLVRFHLYNEMADYIKDRMDKGLLDVGLLLEPVDTIKYDFIRLPQKETWGVLMRDDHPLAGRKTITADEAAQYPLILPLREQVRAEILNWINQDEKDENGKFLRQERYSGSLRRSFYVGNTLMPEDIQAKYETGVLILTVPKKQPEKIERNGRIAIEGGQD